MSSTKIKCAVVKVKCVNLIDTIQGILANILRVICLNEILNLTYTSNLFINFI